jgi:hypothetical protein
MTKFEVNNSCNVIDSRDVIERIEELESIECGIGSAEYDELKSLKALAEEASEYSSDWKYGETLIRYDYFVDYCQELCEDIGDIPRNIPSYIEIDWKATAKNLEVDYTTVDFDGVEYFIRNC